MSGNLRQYSRQKRALKNQGTRSACRNDKAYQAATVESKFPVTESEDRSVNT